MTPTTLTYTELNDRRSGCDRRNLAGISIRLFVGAGKRETIRRQDDKGRIFFVDWDSPKIFAGLLAGIFLSIIDGFLTLLLMDHGAYEVKPSRFSTALYTSGKNPTILKGRDSYMY